MMTQADEQLFNLCKGFFGTHVEEPAEDPDGEIPSSCSCGEPDASFALTLRQLTPETDPGTRRMIRAEQARRRYMFDWETHVEEAWEREVMPAIPRRA